MPSWMDSTSAISLSYVDCAVEKSVAV